MSAVDLFASVSGQVTLIVFYDGRCWERHVDGAEWLKCASELASADKPAAIDAVWDGSTFWTWEAARTGRSAFKA